MDEQGNYLRLSGIINQSPTYGHEVFGEKFYYATLSVPRLSGAEDLLPITLSERLMEGIPLDIGMPLTLEGQLRSYNKVIEGAGRLLITAFAQRILPPDGEEEPQSGTAARGAVQTAELPHYALRPGDCRPDAGGEPRLWQERLYSLHYMGAHGAFRLAPARRRQGNADGSLPEPCLSKAVGRRLRYHENGLRGKRRSSHDGGRIHPARLRRARSKLYWNTAITEKWRTPGEAAGEMTRGMRGRQLL